jgi:hypothetical protein
MMPAIVLAESIVVGVGMVASATHLSRDQIFPSSKSSTVPTTPLELGDGLRNSRGVVAKMT